MSDMALLQDARRKLNKYDCECGSGGPLACDEDCPGDTTSGGVEYALNVLIDEVIALKILLEAKQ